MTTFGAVLAGAFSLAAVAGAGRREVAAGPLAEAVAGLPVVRHLEEAGVAAVAGVAQGSDAPAGNPKSLGRLEFSQKSQVEELYPPP